MDPTLEYASGLKDVLLRKINKTERSLVSLKLDYCRFVFGLSNRSRVIYDQLVYQVVSLDLDLMERTPSGDWTKPGVLAVLFKPGMVKASIAEDELIDLGQHWEVQSTD